MKTYLCIHYKAWLEAIIHFKITNSVALYSCLKLDCAIFLTSVQLLCFETYTAVLCLPFFPNSWQETRQQKWSSESLDLLQHSSNTAAQTCAMTCAVQKVFHSCLLSTAIKNVPSLGMFTGLPGARAKHKSFS